MTLALRSKGFTLIWLARGQFCRIDAPHVHRRKMNWTEDVSLAVIWLVREHEILFAHRFSKRREYYDAEIQHIPQPVRSNWWLFFVRSCLHN